MRTDRRNASDRRHRHLIAEPIERRANRRAEERRDSPRLPVRLRVGSTVVQGELGLGGASFSTDRPPQGHQVTVRCELPALGDLSLTARIVRREVRGTAITVHLAFAELPLQTELRLARWLDQRAR